MFTKPALKKQFADEWEKHYVVRIFRERGFVRKVCPSCGTGFWTLDPEKETCTDASCQPYEFIGQKITRRPWNYVSQWRLFEQFFKREGHTPIKRYPVIDRVRPDLYFTIASIQDFQRIENGKMVFVYPENPLIVPQPCLRFSDMGSVGVSGRHLTSFMMSGQHAFGYPKKGYFKDRCMQLSFRFLTEEMGVPPGDIVYKEDLWAMPDFSAFGPCMETIVRGLEVATHVFMQYTKAGQGFRELDTLVNDTGWGHERLVWLSNGTETMYDCIFGPALEYMQKQTGIRPSKNFARYARFASLLDTDEIRDMTKAREIVAKKVGLDVKELAEEIEPLQALYAIADHTRTLLFAITDGGIPSNVGGGYNLRVLLRRVLALMHRYDMKFDLMKVMENHASFLAPMYPELSTGLKSVKDILEIETERYNKTTEEAKKIIARLRDSGKKFDNKMLATLYESNGVTLDMVKEVTGMEIPDDFYSSLTKKHESRIMKSEVARVDAEPTRQLFYEKPLENKFTAKVMQAKKGQVMLDQTLFSPEVGGQDSDLGTLNGQPVAHVSKIGGVIIHRLNGNFKKGQKVQGEIDMERRAQLNAHHTAIHIINGTARKILGDHVWQAGANKTTEKASLDITHYTGVTDEEKKKIETVANQIVAQNTKLVKGFYDRSEAEKRFGLRIYQGGVIPESNIRIIEIPGVDVEACSGIHVEKTGDVGRIVITGTERTQDGVVRILLKAGNASEKYMESRVRLTEALLEYVDRLPFIDVTDELRKRMEDPRLSREELRKAAEVFEVSVDKLPETLDKFSRQVLEDRKKLDIMEKKSCEKRSMFPRIEERHSFQEIAEHIFWLWKDQRKRIDALSVRAAKTEALKLLNKTNKGRIFEIIPGSRQDLIDTGQALLETNQVHTVVLANETGDIIGLSREADMSVLISEICKKAGGAGGGRKEFAQGKVQLSNLLKIKVF
ncbi:MAG: alanine--tRNA ligase [Candidatus Aenigmatarchaeota archaeon]